MLPNRRELVVGLGGSLAWTALAPLAVHARAAQAPPIKIGQIGVGHAHASKLSVYRASPDYEVVGLVEPDAELRVKAEHDAAFRDVPWMSQEQLLNTPGLQAVLVETRVRDLLDTAEACVAADLHVHIDKPAGQSLPQLQRVLDEAQRRHRLVQLGYMYRYNPGIVLLRDLLARGYLGEPFEVHAVMSKVVDPSNRQRLAEYPGGVMFELGCHLIDLVVGLLGPPQGVIGYARHAAQADDTLLDNMLAVLAYDRALTTIRSTAIEVDGGARRHLVVCGTEGTFHLQPLDDPQARLTLGAAREGYRRGAQPITFPKYDRYIADAADMARIIRGEKETDFSPAHDVAVQRALLMACGLPLDC